MCLTRMLSSFVCALALISTNSYAETMSYPGANCAPLNNTSPYALGLGGITNMSTTALLSVNCPIPISNNSQVTGINGRIASVKMFYVDSHATQEVRCNISSHVPGTGNTVSVFASTGASPYPQNYTFPSANQYGPDGIIYLSCSLPFKTPNAASSILSYTVEYF